MFDLLWTTEGPETHQQIALESASNALYGATSPSGSLQAGWEPVSSPILPAREFETQVSSENGEQASTPIEESGIGIGSEG